MGDLAALVSFCLTGISYRIGDPMAHGPSQLCALQYPPRGKTLHYKLMLTVLASQNVKSTIVQRAKMENIDKYVYQIGWGVSWLEVVS